MMIGVGLLAFGGILMLLQENSIEEMVEVQDGSSDSTIIDTDIAKDSIKEVVDEDGTRHVPTLDMSGWEVSEVPMNVFGHTELVVLNLSNNNLSGALQAEVRHLKNLERLDLSYNQFTGVPAEVGQLSKLRYLDLSHNQLTGLPYELGNLQNLETLVLTGNDYSTHDLDIIKEKLPDSVEIVR